MMKEYKNAVNLHTKLSAVAGQETLAVSLSEASDRVNKQFPHGAVNRAVRVWRVA